MSHRSRARSNVFFRFLKFATRSHPHRPPDDTFAGRSAATSVNPCTPRAKKIARPLGKADYDSGLLWLFAVLGALLAVIYFTWGHW